jgi:hypothetical protein
MGRKKIKRPVGRPPIKQNRLEALKHIEINAQGQSPLLKLTKESEISHRAFLLWVMQVESRRNISPVAKAVSRSYATAFRYKTTWNWLERAKYSATSDVEAQRLYNEIYGSRFGTSEIEFVQHLIAAPISLTDGKVRSVAEGVERSIAETKPKENNFTKEVKRKHLILIDAAIGYLASGMKDGSLRKNLRDLPTLIALRRELLDDGFKGKGSKFVAESLRVKHAKENDGDIVEAMLEDTEELIAILSALRMRGKGVLAIHGEVKNA